MKMKTPMLSSRKTAFYQKLLLIVIPIAFQQFMLAAVNASDALMLGFVNQDSLSAVSLAGQVAFIFNLFMGGLATGTSVMSAQYYGKGDMDTIEKVFAYVLKIALSVSVVFFVFSLFAPSVIMRFFTSDIKLIRGGAVYLRIVAASFVFTAVSQVYLCILKNTGYAVKSMIIGSCAVVINIALNAALIFGIGFLPKMGIAGAALATSVSKLLEALWAYAESLKKDRAKLRGRYFFAAEKIISKDYWHYTAPALGNSLAWGVGFSMYSVIMGHLGSDAVAANSIANIVKNLIVSYCTGLASGGSIIVGNELGTGNLQGAKQYGSLLCRLSVICGIVAGGILLALTPFVLSIVELTPTANMYLKYMLILCACYLVGKSINMTTIGGIFPAGGDTKFGFICDFVTMWAVAVPIGFMAAFWWKLPVIAVFLIINLDEIVKLPVVIRHYRKYNWLKNITR